MQKVFRREGTCSFIVLLLLLPFWLTRNGQFAVLVDIGDGGGGVPHEGVEQRTQVQARVYDGFEVMYSALHSTTLTPFPLPLPSEFRAIDGSLMNDAGTR